MIDGFCIVLWYVETSGAEVGGGLATDSHGQERGEKKAFPTRVECWSSYGASPQGISKQGPEL